MHSWASVAIPPIDARFELPALKLWNTATNSPEVVPKKSVYRMYVCGITPYDATHLGHANTYIAFDLLNRYLRATGSRVIYVQNITDIDDPLLERANRDGVDWRELANSQIDLFRADMVALHVLPPAHYIGAVEAIPLVTKAIESLNQVNATYLVDEDTYLDLHKDLGFGKISHLSPDEMLEIFAQRGGDPERVGKQHALDPLLWLKQRSGEPGWESALGKGRPGWHIECCAIALNYLDVDNKEHTTIDIQGGGSDLIFPHHEMSATQAKLITGKEFARHYVHSGMVGFEGEKMSKSKGNLVFVSKLIASGVDPMVIRLALLMHHYRDDHMWSNEELGTASEFLDDLRTALSRTEVAPTDTVIAEIIAALANNLDTPRAITVLSEWVTQSLSGSEDCVSGGSAGELSRAIDALLGIAL